MKKQKNKYPLGRRIPRELFGDWKKYLIVSLFLILTVGFVSGMYVANESMMTAANEGVTKYKLENGHFELKKQADSELLESIACGEKADVKAYYLEKAKTEFDEKFEHEFKVEFSKEFDSEFAKEFDPSFEQQLKSALLAQSLDEGTADTMLPSLLEEAKESGEYQTAYDSAYKEGFRSAYEEAYPKAYNEAWNKIAAEVEEKYADAEEKYELNDPDFQPVPVTVYGNFFRNEEEDNNNDGTVRVYAKTDNINLACLLDGRFPETENEIAIDRMHADNVGVKVGDKITVGKKEWNVVGLIAYVNYSTLYEKSSDFMFDALKFNVAEVTEEGFTRLENPVHYAYAWQYINAPEDEKEEKKSSDDFMKSLLTQTVVAENEIEDYLPAYANQAIHFATDDMGSDEAMGGVLLDILIVIIAFIFAVTISNTITKESKTIGTLRASGYTRWELVRHYLAMPVIVTLFAAVSGNLLGYTVFKNAVVSMYYNSYSLPVYETVWSPTALFKTTTIPLILMFVVNLAVILRKMRHTPLEFLRQDLKKDGRKKAIRLPNRKFFSRFRMRIIFQNIPNYLILFFGIFFVCVMLAMAIGMPDTLGYYKENAKDMMFANYQYVLTSYKDGNSEIITTANENAEVFGMKSLQRKSEAIDEEISVYGIADGSSYVKIGGLDALGDREVSMRGNAPNL